MLNMHSEEVNFSSLKTVTAFDRGGEESTIAVDLGTDELKRFSPSSLLVESLIEQLCRLLEKDPRKWKPLYLKVCEKLHHMNLIDESYEKEEFEFMRSYYQKALFQLLTIAKSTSVDSKSLCSLPASYIPKKGVIEWSRYATEFEELDYIARGGFGHVYKAQHKLDGGLYAIKKICLSYDNLNDFLKNLQEVKLLARLNHPNIVSYKAAWLEPFNKGKTSVAAIVDIESTNEDKDNSLEVVFECSQKSINITEEESENTKYSSTTFSSSNEVLLRKYSRSTEITGELPEYAILYIQMQLCRQTLRQWLDIRNTNTNNIDIEQSNIIFRQVVRGVEYIHSQGIVHHDIKPSNIFISHNLKEVQVGDFGLACNLLNHQPSISVITTHQPGQMGTKLYAAPEQLRGHCHPKSDVYSLGIVLFELLQPFSTAMERSKVITQLKSGHMPSTLVSTCPLLGKVISHAINNSLKRRPSSTELLSLIEESESMSTQQVLAQQNKMIAELRHESLIKDKEIASLREELEKLKMERMTL